jgi:hypothetical protein
MLTQKRHRYKHIWQVLLFIDPFTHQFIRILNGQLPLPILQFTIDAKQSTSSTNPTFIGNKRE